MKMERLTIKRAKKSFDIQVCESYEAALEAMEGRENDEIN